jgi:hypothetical protein
VVTTDAVELHCFLIQKLSAARRGRRIVAVSLAVRALQEETDLTAASGYTSLPVFVEEDCISAIVGCERVRARHPWPATPGYGRDVQRVLFARI